ncbi:MAG: HAD family hydrolase [Methylohalobius crimeensis]|uniref:HAD family hydrolase n=1 Tax=Methylohalobius crimeensis TaxID=244365 RepID=UPI0003B6159C|nr:HAD family hydrolase [Methylohalobius crimeensis]
MTTIRLISFDLDNTVWPTDPVLRQAENEAFRWLQQRAPRLASSHDLNSLRAHRQALMRQQPAIAHDMTAVRLASLRLLLEAFEYPLALADEAMAIFLRARNRVTPYPDAPPVLETLAQTHRLVSLTNGNADVTCTPLGPHFHFSLTAAGVGAAKPSPEMFLKALAQAGVEAGHSVHVGDDPHLDIHAAREVGMRAVWVNREGASWPRELPPPDTAVRNLYELIDWLALLPDQPLSVV